MRKWVVVEFGMVFRGHSVSPVRPVDDFMRNGWKVVWVACHRVAFLDAYLVACGSAEGQRCVLGEALRVCQCVAMVVVVQLCRWMVIGIHTVQLRCGYWVEVCVIILL